MKGNPVSSWIYLIGGIIIAAMILGSAHDIISGIERKRRTDISNMAILKLIEYAKTCKETTFNSTLVGPLNITTHRKEICINGECYSTECEYSNYSFTLPKGAYGNYIVDISGNKTNWKVSIWLQTS